MLDDSVFGLLDVFPNILDSAFEHHVLLLLVAKGSLADHQCDAFLLALALGVAEFKAYRWRDYLSHG